MKRIFIVNPIAGNGKALKLSKSLKEICELEKLNHKIIYTTGPGSAKEIAKQYSSAIEETVVYSVGGDGTLNEVVNGIMNSNAVLGVIPAGTGNDFHRMINAHGQRVGKIDIGKVNDRYFINIASLGLDANIAARVNKIKNKIIPNDLVYLISTFGELINFKHIDLQIDEGINKQLIMLTVCNGAYYGGGIKLAPFASINDGLLEVYEVSKINRLQALKLLSLTLKGQHIDSDFVEGSRTDYITAESLTQLVCNVDGETIVNKKFVFENIADGLNLLYNDHPKIMNLHKNKNRY